jgi:hypothetical protein
MNPTRSPQESDPARRQRAQRAARGLVAQYIHEISGRHTRGAPPQPLAAEGNPALVELKEDG